IAQRRGTANAVAFAHVGRACDAHPESAASGGMRSACPDRKTLGSGLSAAAQRVHDLDPVAGLELAGGVLAARHDFTVDLHRHPACAQALRLEQGQHAGVGGDLGGLAVEFDIHGAIVARVVAGCIPGGRRAAVRRERDAAFMDTCRPCGPVLWPPSHLLESCSMPRTPTRSRPVAGLLAAALALAAAPAIAEDTFSRTVFFGDSLTDAGYFRPLMVQQNPQAAILGRFTTNPGLVWAEWLALAYGTDATPNGNGQSGDNYAAGCAMVATDRVGPPFGLTPSLASQAAAYLGSTGGRADPDALYSVWGGPNDLFSIQA